MKTCLIVDDSSVVRKVIRGYLDELEFACSEAADGSLAMQECEKQMPDLIMLDWNMPVMDGMTFLKTLRASSGGDKPTVIFCTTENTVSKMCEAMKEGAQDFIMKPFNREILRSKLEQNNIL